MKKLFLILFLLIINSFVFASGLKGIQDKFSSIKDFTVNVSQTGGVNLKGKLSFKKENKMRLELNDVLLISDGTTNWNYNSKQNKVLITEADDSETGLLSLNAMIFDYPKLCSVTENESAGKNIIILKPKKSNLSFREITITANKDNLIEKVEIVDTNGGKSTITFSNYKLDQNLNDTLFSYKPAEGTSVIDLR